MGVEIRTEGKLVTLRVSGRVGFSQVNSRWVEVIRETAEAHGQRVSLLCIFEPDLELPIQLLSAGVRQMVAIVHLVHASAIVARGERERAMLRASTLAVGPAHWVEMFHEEASARAWLLEQSRSRAVTRHDLLRSKHEGFFAMPLELAPRG